LIESNIEIPDFDLTVFLGYEEDILVSKLEHDCWVKSTLVKVLIVGIEKSPYVYFVRGLKADGILLAGLIYHYFN